MTTRTLTLALDAGGRLRALIEDLDGNREWRTLDPDELAGALAAEYQRLRADRRDALGGGHEPEAHWSYLRAIGAA